MQSQTESHNMQVSSSTSSVRSGRAVTILSWTLRIVAAAIFIGAGGAKLAGVPMMVAIFDQIGFGQWFRVLTGAVEVIGGVALLIGSTAAWGALLLASMMVVAIATHVFIIGGSALPAAVLFVLTATIVWLRRGSIASLLNADR
jgi:putative oxidoreductase